MPHVIAPMSVSPDAAPDRLTAYWRAAICAAAYAENQAGINALATLANASSVTLLPLPGVLPDKVFVISFAGNGAMVLVNGTTRPSQWVAHVLGAALQTSAGWQGKVNGYFALSAVAVRNAVLPVLESLAPSQVVYVGHSFGGAVAVLLATLSQPWNVAGIWTIGQPRVGSLSFAQSVLAAHERYTNTGDPVPQLPPASNPLLDATLVPIWPLQLPSYAHGGQRRLLSANGDIGNAVDASNLTAAAVYLVNVVRTSDGWFGAHSSTTYACRLRQQLPVQWRAASLDYPQVAAIDTVLADSLGATGHCPDELFTLLQADPLDGAPGYAREAICR